MSLMTLHCPECCEDRLFERPHPAAERHDSAAERRDHAQCHDLVEPLAERPDAERPDGEGGSGECAEFACVECGTALFAGFALPIMVGTPEHTRARRRPPGRAA
jgi:hypothetical protein